MTMNMELRNRQLVFMYGSEDLEIKCQSNTMKLASIVEMHPLLYKDSTSSTRQRHCPMVNRYMISRGSMDKKKEIITKDFLKEITYIHVRGCSQRRNTQKYRV